MGFAEILATSLVPSLLVPIGMAFMPPATARRTATAAWAVLLPILTISCGTLAAHGEGGFLSTFQAVSTGAFLLALSFGLGYGASSVFHAKPPDTPQT